MDTVEKVFSLIDKYGITLAITVFVLTGIYVLGKKFLREGGVVDKVTNGHTDLMKTLEQTTKLQASASVMTADCLEELKEDFKALRNAIDHQSATESQWRQVAEISIEGLEMVAEKKEWGKEFADVLKNVKQHMPKPVRAT